MDEKFVSEVVADAMDALREIAQDENVNPKDRVAASKVMLEAVSQNYADIQKLMITQQMMPMLETVSKSLHGAQDENSYSPIFELDAVEQANFALNIVSNLNH